jgi:fused signal recognition particle receptor
VAKEGFAARLAKIFGSGDGNEEVFEDFEDLLIEGDFGAVAAMEVSDQLRTVNRDRKLKGRDEIFSALREILVEQIRVHSLEIVRDRLNIILVLGVNGVGKTTTIAKVAQEIRTKHGIDGIVLCAADTFRAGAIEQLSIQGERLGLRVVHQQSGSDPGAVVYDAIESAKARSDSVILVDTAGRMHNKANLVKELQKIDKVITSRAQDANYQRVLVIDANTGQNAFRQAEIFNEAVGINSCILAKYDGSAKGGVAVGISRQLSLPFSYLGVGESLTDLEPFRPESYVENLLGGV